MKAKVGGGERGRGESVRREKGGGGCKEEGGGGEGV